MLIAQHTITATPKYNFPQPTIDTTLPQRLTQLSLNSLKPTQTQPIQLNQQPIQQINNIDTHTYALQLNLNPITLHTKRQETTVTAVDTSSIKIGETSTGTLIAIRAANVWKQNRQYRYTRLGPFIFHITEQNKKEVYVALQRTYFNTPNDNNHRGSPTLLQMPTRLASLLERWLQAMLTKTANNSLILFDGSLTAGTPDTPARQAKETLQTARNRGNTVLAFSKMTTLRFNGHLITEFPLKHQPPYLLETAGLKTKPPIVLLGNVYVAKLTSGNCAFRLDIDKEIPTEERITAIEKLLGNDLLSQSYPETLRLAHILCTFTANEVIAMKHFITRKCKIKIVNRPDMHRLLFGAYGKGESN